jgi:hypothetical protein
MRNNRSPATNQTTQDDQTAAKIDDEVEEGVSGAKGRSEALEGGE